MPVVVGRAFLDRRHADCDLDLDEELQDERRLKRSSCPGRNGERNFYDEKPANAPHASTTDPEAKLYRKGQGKEAKLSFIGHTLMDNRRGLVVAATLTPATETAERKPAEEMIVRYSPRIRRITLGADNDAVAFVAGLQTLNVTPHIAQNNTGGILQLMPGLRGIPAMR